MTNTPHDPQQDFSQTGNKYGTANYQSGQNVDPTKPAQIKRWAQVTLASLGLFLLNMLLSIMTAFHPDTQEVLRAQFEGQEQTLPEGVTLDDWTNTMSASLAVFSAIIAVLGLLVYVLVLLGIRKRWGWSRVVGIVVCIIATLILAWSVVDSLAQLGSGLTIVALLTSLLLVVVNVYWLILAFNSNVATWINSRFGRA
ncbi:MAG: hypothetical protein Q4C81_00740 [Kocuria sp.]|nr:hypothetical protein [Kocuria sp.]